MSQLIPTHRKLTQAEWILAKHLRFNRSENARLEADKLLAESNRLREESLQLARATTADVDKKLEQRIDDVDYWRSEVNRRQVNIKDEIDYLASYKSRFERAMDGLARISDIDHQCCILREQRQGVDLVQDNVQDNLLKEVEVIFGIRTMYQKAMDQLLEQIRLNRKTRYHLENDLCNKSYALRLDNFSAVMSPHSQELMDSSGQFVEPYKTPSVESREFSIHDWRKVTMAILSKAESELNHSVQIRGVLDGILSQAASDLRYQVGETNRAFIDRINETRATKAKLEEEHAELERQVTAIEVNLENLQTTVAELEKPLALAQSRLTVRSKRPDVESCADSPQLQLKAEVNQLKKSLDGILMKIRESELSLQQLLRNKLEVEEDIKIKSQTLYIDEVQCDSLRKSIFIDQY